MSGRPERPVRIIGLGNPMRGDDAVGLLVARQLRGRVGEQAEVIEAEMAGLELLEWLKGAQAAFLVDAVQSGAEPGTIHRYDASTNPISSISFPHSSHALSGADALELARTLGQLPPTVIVFGIEIGDTGLGRPLSSDVARAVEAVVETVCRECAALACMNSS